MKLDTDLSNDAAMRAGAALLGNPHAEVARFGAELVTRATAERRRAEARLRLTQRWYELQAAYASAIPIPDY